MFKFTKALTRQGKHSFSLLTRINYYSASSTSPTSLEYKNNQIEVDELQQQEAAAASKTTTTRIIRTQRSSNIVAAAFASLKHDTKSGEISTPFTDKRLETATDVNDLLSISDGVGVSRKHALKVVSILADWTGNGKITLADFESDERFIKLCKVLTKTANKFKSNVVRNEDLSMIMNLTADDEAAKLVASITLPQMVKVMQTLAMKKRRSTALLRSLSYNITRSTEKLDLKQSADLLYSMAVLNFPDENLLERIQNDIVCCLDNSLKRSAVVGSIVTSLGLLRYKDAGIMDAICNWFIENYECVRPQDVFGLFLTLGVLNFEPMNTEKLFQLFLPQINAQEAIKPSVWLDFVWSLVLLGKASNEYISSVLSEQFIKELMDNSTSNLALKLKLMNINAVAENALNDYNGPTLDKQSIVWEANIVRTKEKEDLVNSVLDTLKNLMHSDKYINLNVNTAMGFYIDAEFVLDKKCNPVLLKDIKDVDPTQHFRIALIVLDYHDLCRGGRMEPIGLYMLVKKLLAHRGYNVIFVPYSEFKVQDKLIHRVQYLETKLKAIIKSTS